MARGNVGDVVGLSDEEIVQGRRSDDQPAIARAQRVSVITAVLSPPHAEPQDERARGFRSAVEMVVSSQGSPQVGAVTSSPGELDGYMAGFEEGSKFAKELFENEPVEELGPED